MSVMMSFTSFGPRTTRLAIWSMGRSKSKALIMRWRRFDSPRGKEHSPWAITGDRSPRKTGSDSSSTDHLEFRVAEEGEGGLSGLGVLVAEGQAPALELGLGLHLHAAGAVGEVQGQRCHQQQLLQEPVRDWRAEAVLLLRCGMDKGGSHESGSESDAYPEESRRSVAKVLTDNRPCTA